MKDCAVYHRGERREAVCPLLQTPATKQAHVAKACEMQSRTTGETCAAGLAQVWDVVTAAECTGNSVLATQLPEEACAVLVQTTMKRQAVTPERQGPLGDQGRTADMETWHGL